MSNEHCIPASDTEVQEQMFQNLTELELLSSKAVGLCTVMVLENGDLKTFTVYAKGGKFPLLAGLTLTQHSFLHLIETLP